MQFVTIDNEIIIQPNNIKLNDIKKSCKINLVQNSNKLNIEFIKQEFNLSNEDWSYISKKIYDKHLSDAKRKREEDLANPNMHICATNNDEIADIIQVNNQLFQYALSMPTFCTMHEFKTIKAFIDDKSKVINYIKRITMEPNIRAAQQIGRFEKIPLFEEFSKIINAGLLSYYRGNYISSYMTLVPVIEGIILRWYGYPNNIGSNKPSFDKVKNFIKKTYQRQPMPSNILFMEVHSKIADKILKEHFFKPSTDGDAYDNFNRHLALHFLNKNKFITEENIMRLFILLDLLSEIYIYEEYHEDPRFNLTNEERKIYTDIYRNTILMSQTNINNFENKLNLKTH